MPTLLKQQLDEAERLEETIRQLDPTNAEDGIYECREDLVADAGYWTSDDDEHGYLYPPDWEPDDGSGMDGSWEVISGDSDMLASYIESLKEMVDKLKNETSP
jgi:hypothetical protein